MNEKKRSPLLTGVLCVIIFLAAAIGTGSCISHRIDKRNASETPAAQTTQPQRSTETTPPESESETAETQQTQTDAPTEKQTEEETQTDTPTDTPTEAETAPEELTLGQKNAVRSAVQYIETLAFSHDRLIEQLEYSGFTHEEAVYGADNCGADWNAEAAEAAKNYIDTLALSRERLIEQLIYDKFTQEQAEYGASSVGY